MTPLIRWLEIIKSRWFLQPQTGLAKIAIHAEPNEWNVLAAQTDALTDQHLIRKVATEAKGAPIRRAVIHKLIDQSLVARIAIEDPSDLVAEAAVTALKNQEELAEVAMTAKRPAPCRAALAKLTEQRWIEKVALEAVEPSTRKYASWRLTHELPHSGQMTRKNLGAILSQYSDLSDEEKKTICIQLTQCAARDPNFWKAVVDELKKDSGVDISDRIAILDAISPTGKMTKEIGDRYYSS